MIEHVPVQSRFHRAPEPSHLPANRTSPEVPHDNLLRLALRWWWVTPCCLVAALATAKLYIVKTSPVYQANSRIYIQQNRPKILEGDNPFAVQQSATYLNTQSELIQSTPVLALAVDDVPTSVSSRAQPIGYVKGGLSVGINKNDDIMTVSFESTDPAEAAEVANAVVRAYMSYQSNELQSTVAEVQRILEKEKNQRDADVSVKLKKLNQFKQENVSLASDSEKSAVVSRAMTTLSDKLAPAQLDESEAETNFAAAQAVANGPDKANSFIAGLRFEGVLPPNRAADDAYALLRQLKQQKSALEAQYGPTHPVVQKATAQIDSVQPEKIEKEANLLAFQNYLSSSAEVLDMRKSMVQRLQRSYDEKQREAAAISAKVAEYQRSEADLLADSQRAERLYEQADGRVKEISIGQDIGQAKVQVLEPARPSFEPVRPQKLTVLGIAIGLGVVLGLSGIMVCDWMDQRFRSPEQVLSDLTVPVLGSVPHIPTGKNIVTAAREVLLDPMSYVAEGYRTIRTAIYFGMHDGRTKTILVTSPIAGEGKTTMVSNLGIAMAQAGRRTLILDADFRKPMQHIVFQLNPEVGLSSVLAGGANVSDAIQPSGISRLDVLACGPVPMNPSESLNSEGFAQLLRQVSEDYDCVLLDSAPILPVTDARIFAAICDLTVLVLRAEKSTRKTSLQARNSLYSVGAEIAGIVLNDVSPWGRGYSHYTYKTRRQKSNLVAELTGEPMVERMPELGRNTQIELAGPAPKTRRRKKE